MSSQENHTSGFQPSTDPDRFKELPEGIRLEDTVTSADVAATPEEKDDYWREVEWMLRTTGLGGLV